MSNDPIRAIVDRHLQLWIDNGLNACPVPIDPEMTMPNEPIDNEGWQKWFPIKSAIIDSDIDEIEKQLGFTLPTSYKAFLKYKHFYDLHISEAHFARLDIRNWKQNLLNMVYDNFPTEFLIDKGYIPFADWNDWGVLCFDTNGLTQNNDYPVILWDHDNWEEYQPFAENFEQLLIKLDNEISDNGS